MKNKALSRYIISCTLGVIFTAGNAVAGTDPLDTSTRQVSSCEWNKLNSELGELKQLSWTEQSSVCQELQFYLKRPPTVGAVRKAALASSAFNSLGLTGTPKQVTHQLLNVAEARGVTSDNRLAETYETLFKIFGGTNGLVTPNDINMTLRAIGPGAKKIDEDGLFNMAALIQNEKKKRGY